MPSASDEAAPGLSNLDQLMLEYLDAVDVYQSHMKSLSSRFSAGFLALAQANYHATGGVRYGSDLYDGRMAAMRGVEIRMEEAGEAVFEEKRIELPAEDEVEEEKDEGGMRRRHAGKGTENEEASEDRKEEKETEEKAAQKPAVDRRDPLRWFGLLVPPALRTVQSEFTASLSTLFSISSTLSLLSRLEQQIAHHKRAQHVYKILPFEPADPLPDEVPPLPLDEADGFVHMCTAVQVQGVVTRFMNDVPRIWVLQVDYDRIARDTKWEAAGDVEAEAERFPHLFRGLRGEEVVKITIMEKGEKDWMEVFSAPDGRAFE